MSLAPDAAAPTSAPAAPRKGGALFRATAPFAVESRSTTWRLMATSLAAAALMAVAVAAIPLWLWPIKLVGSAILGLIFVRLFIFVHDEAHGAIFREDRLGKLLCDAIALFLLTPPTVWKETHDYHHRNNAKMTGAAIGSYPTVTTRVWAMLKPSDRRAYAIARNPLTMVAGYLTVFVIGMCVSPFRRAPKQHWQGPVALVLHAALLTAVTLTLGWAVALFVVLIPQMIAMAAGSYLFYVQHNFPDVDLKDRKEWDYTHAALRSSSMFDMSPWMHWLTGNIGYHHVHHLNHRIPFYRLPEAMAAIPELQDPGRTSWRVKDISAALRLKLWDPGEKRMVGWPRT